MEIYKDNLILKCYSPVTVSNDDFPVMHKHTDILTHTKKADGRGV